MIGILVEKVDFCRLDYVLIKYMYRVGFYI